MASAKARKYISYKIKKIRKDNPRMPRKQVVAIALALARKRGYKIGKRRR